MQLESTLVRMAKYLLQILVLGTRAVGRAFVTALRQEYLASQAAAAARQGGRSSGASGKGMDNDTATNLRHGISVEEARQILNVSPEDQSKPEEVQKRFDHLFKINQTSQGGSFYIQSKIYRAKERLDMNNSKQTTSNSR